MYIIVLHCNSLNDESLREPVVKEAS